MAQDTTQADAILQNIYLPMVREMVNYRAITLFGYTPEEVDAGAGTANALNGETQNYRGISKDASRVEFAGRQWVIAVHKSRNESGNARDENGTLPTAGQQGWADLIDKVRRHYKRIQLSGFSMAVTKRTVGAYVNLFTAETEGAINDLRKDLNRQGFGDQRGALCNVVSDGTNNFVADNLQYLRVGMILDFMNTTNDTALATQRTVTAITRATRTVAYNGADVTLVAGTHVPCLEGNWKKEINGLTNITRSDTYTTLHGIDSSVAGNEYWLAQQANGGGTTFDEDQGQLLLDNIGQSGWEAEMLVTTRGVRRRYVNTLKAQKRFNDTMAGVLHGGFKYIDFNGVTLIYDDDCPKGYMYAIDPDDFLWIFLNGEDFNWMQEDGAILNRVLNQDAYEATLFRYGDLGCERRMSQGAIYSLADDIP